MKAETIATYVTRTGKIAYAIKRHVSTRDVTYSYFGKYGAGSGHPLSHVQAMHRLNLCCHRGIRLESGADVLTLVEP